MIGNRIMICPKCNAEMEYFGSIFVKEDGKVWKKNFGVCKKHIPYTPITLINKEEIKDA